MCVCVCCLPLIPCRAAVRSLSLLEKNAQCRAASIETLHRRSVSFCSGAEAAAPRAPLTPPAPVIRWADPTGSGTGNAGNAGADELCFRSAGSDMAIFCLLCGKRFQTQTALQQHMDVHAGVRSYICSECNRTFPSHTALKRHLRSHTGRWSRRLCFSGDHRHTHRSLTHTQVNEASSVSGRRTGTCCWPGSPDVLHSCGSPEPSDVTSAGCRSAVSR